LAKNVIAGKAFEKVAEAQKVEQGSTKIATQVTLETASGTRVRMDIVSTSTAGNIELTEAKASQTAPLTSKQKVGYPEIATGGAVVRGQNGLPNYPPGSTIPPTKVEVIRPKN
jgi:hypothetical protein